MVQGLAFEENTRFEEKHPMRSKHSIFGQRWLCKAKRPSSMNLFCRRFALVSAVGQAKIERRQRIRHRAFVSLKQATLGRAARPIRESLTFFYL